VVTQEFARRIGLDADVIGKQIDQGPGQKPINIVGIVGDVRTRSLETATYPEIYLSSLQFTWANVYLVVRSPLPPAQLVKDIKAAIQSANSDQAVYGAMTMEEMIAASQSQPRFNAYLIGAFALLALSMAVAGMYSVIACLVSQRTGEIAIRMVLGATRGDIIRAIVGATGLYAAAGLTGGLAAGFAARNLLRTLSNTAVQGAPWMYFAIAFFFLLVMLLAVYVPVRRATRLDPALALRCE
jgi:putative ABC transport system permease protein